MQRSERRSTLREKLKTRWDTLGLLAVYKGACGLNGSNDVLWLTGLREQSKSGISCLSRFCD
jgi:hypothetical protein